MLRDDVIMEDVCPPQISEMASGGRAGSKQLGLDMVAT